MRIGKLVTDRSAWQFSLRGMMVFVTIFCVILGLGKWLGGIGLVGCVLAIALWGFVRSLRYRRKRMILFAGSVLVTVVAGIPLFYFFGRYKVEFYECDTCYRRTMEVTILDWNFARLSYAEGNTCSSRQLPTAPHEHCWDYLNSYEQDWGGKGVFFQSPTLHRRFDWNGVK